MFGKFLSIIKAQKWLTIALGIFLLIACILLSYYQTTNMKDIKHRQQIVEVKLEKVTTPIFFNGTVEPLQLFNVISPVEGLINEVFFKYGENIKINQKLFSVSAEKLEKEYIDTVSNYLKAIDDYSEKTRKFKGTEKLWNLKFISDNDYFSDKIAQKESFFMLKQSTKNLKDTLSKIGIKRDLKQIDVHNPKAIEEIITEKLDDYVIYSLYSGIALDPKNLTSIPKDDASKNLGSEIKQGEVLLYIGDLKGIAIEVKINEMDINQIKPEQKAIITGPGFSEFMLEGKVEFVKSQAHGDNGALPTFPVRIIVNELTPEQRAKIKVGMSAKVEIRVLDKEAIIVPISAVFQEKGHDFVHLKDKVSGKIKAVPVTVGKALVDAVEIERGLSPGDHVVVDD